MTVKQMREMLAVQDQDDEVMSYDADAEQDMPVTGCIYGNQGVVLLQTDDIS